MQTKFIFIRSIQLALLTLCGVASTQAAEWQWSVLRGQGRAFLWIPPHCQQMLGDVVAQNNMIELGILEHESFSKTLTRENIGEVFIAPPFEFIFRFDKDAGEKFDGVMRQLADVSGYSELNFAPLVPLGHSACASFLRNFAAWKPERVTSFDQPVGSGSGEPVTPNFVPDSDGVTFHLRTAFMYFVPTNGNAARWACSPAGTSLGHASDCGAIQLRKIVGPVVQTSSNTV